MGASASASSFAEIQKIYEARKDKLSDEDLMREILACVAAREEVDDDPEAQKQRSELFLYACGAYRKETQTAQANLTEATNLWFQGVDTRFKDSDKWTALHHAAGEGHTKIVEFLIQECKANLEEVDEFNCSALWVAACNDRRDAVKVLLIAGADTEIQGKPEDEPSQKPALAARRNRHPGLGDLIDAEAELRAADPMRKQRQLSQEMTLQEFNESMRSSLKGGNQGAAV
jgi:ankyrin repeat protein